MIVLHDWDFPLLSITSYLRYISCFFSRFCSFPMCKNRSSIGRYDFNKWNDAQYKDFMGFPYGIVSLIALFKVGISPGTLFERIRTCVHCLFQVGIFHATRNLFSDTHSSNFTSCFQFVACRTRCDFTMMKLFSNVQDHISLKLCVTLACRTF